MDLKRQIPKLLTLVVVEDAEEERVVRERRDRTLEHVA